MTAGDFEIERTKTRDPGERPRQSAVSIEAGFVPSDEPEPDYEEPVEEEEIEAEDAEESAAEGEDVGESETSHRSEGGQREDRGGRRRRRRGGRGRGRDRGERTEGQADAGISAASQAAQTAEAGPAEAEEGQSDDQADHQDEHGAPQPGENGEARRKRRRRRGRRGGRDRADQLPGDSAPQAEGMEHHQTGFVAEADRFGAIPDEIDTTPSDTRHTPGAPSAPVWSLKDDIPDTTPFGTSRAPFLSDNDEIDTTPQDDNKPKKKGWWQKTFGGE